MELLSHVQFLFEPAHLTIYEHFLRKTKKLIIYQLLNQID